MEQAGTYEETSRSRHKIKNEEILRREKEIPLTPETIENYLDSLAAKGRVPRTIEGYRGKLKRLYQDLPGDKNVIRRDTLTQWREKLARDGYSNDFINQAVIVINGYLNFMGAREFQIVDKLKFTKEIQPELTRREYLRLLSTARTLDLERSYLLVKVFGNSALPVQELSRLTVEAAREGMVNISHTSAKEIVRFPKSICKELLSYANRKGILTGPIFLTRNGVPMHRSAVTVEIRRLCHDARVPEEKGNPRCLRKLYLATREGMERNIELLVEQAQERVLEEENLTVGWDNGL